MLQFSIAHSNIAKAASTALPIFLARLPEPAVEYDRSGLTRFNRVGFPIPNSVGDSGVHLVRTDGQRSPSSPIPGVGLGALVPRTESTALGGLVPLAEGTVLGGLTPRAEHDVLGGFPFTSTAFHNFRTHKPHMGLTVFLLPRKESSLVFLPQSPLPKAVPAAGRSRLRLAPF